MWNRVRALVVKELLALWKDRKVRFVLLVPPLVQTLVFSYAATFEVRNVALAVWNEDRGPRAHELIARFEGSPAFVRVADIERPAEAAAMIAGRRALAVLHVGQTFSADLAAGRPAGVQLIIDGGRSSTALTIQGYAAAILAEFNREVLGPAAPRAETVLRAWFNPNLDSQWFIVPGLVALLTVVVTMLITALSVARERELGTFEQLLVTPLTPVEIILGKTVPALIVGFVQASAILLVAVVWFRIPFAGSLALLYAAVGVFLLSAIGIGLAISSLCNTQQQAILGVFMYLAPAIVLSGFATPIANMPAWCQWLTYGNPLRYMLILARGIFLRDLPAALAWAQLWPMALIGAVTLVLAAWLFRRRLG